MRLAVKMGALLMVCFLATSCATLMTGKFQKVSVTTMPAGAIAVCEGVQVITPGVFTLRRDSDHAITISKEGYHDEIVLLKKTMSGAVAGNILLGGIIGGAVDMATGAAYKLTPDSVMVGLKQTGTIKKAVASESEEEQMAEADKTLAVEEKKEEVGFAAYTSPEEMEKEEEKAVKEEQKAVEASAVE